MRKVLFRCGSMAGLSLLFLLGCGNNAPVGTSAADGNGPFSVTFRTAGTPQAAARPALTKPIVMQGTNGELVLNDLRMVIDKFQLEGQDTTSVTPAGEEAGETHENESKEACREGHYIAPVFKAPPHFLDLDLTQTDSDAVVVQEPVPVGIYTRLNFQIDDPDGDSLFAAIRQDVPDWPRMAGLMVTGTFTPKDSTTAEPFRVFFRGKVKIQMALDPPLTIQDQDQEKVASVTLDPARWFENAGNTVVDLTKYDFDTTGRIPQLEVRLSDGFTLIAIRSQHYWRHRD